MASDAELARIGTLTAAFGSAPMFTGAVPITTGTEQSPVTGAVREVASS